MIKRQGKFGEDENERRSSKGNLVKVFAHQSTSSFLPKSATACGLSSFLAINLLFSRNLMGIPTGRENTPVRSLVKPEWPLALLYRF